MRVSLGPKAPVIHPNTHTPIPQDTPRSSLSHLFLGGQRVLGDQVAQALLSLQEALSHPVRETRKRGDTQLRQQIAFERGGSSTNHGASKDAGTYCGSCPASEASGTLREQEREQASQNSRYFSFHPQHHIYLVTLSPGSPLGPGSPGRANPGAPCRWNDQYSGVYSLHLPHPRHAVPSVTCSPLLPEAPLGPGSPASP